MQRYLCEAEQRTAGGKTLTLILALNYSSRSEITRAVQRIAARVAAGELAPGEISEGTVSASLDTAPYPNPDLVVRTSGECRLSNFLLWQASYAELYFRRCCGPISPKRSSTGQSRNTPAATDVSGWLNR